MKSLMFADFENRCEVAAIVLEDRLTRYISTPQEHDLAMLAAWRLILLALQRLASPAAEKEK